ncbi:phage Gp37/Gp68 family protein [Agrobacterium vitis]|uniref:phage Gp37/Gp68 family protein n=1 Tax=Agrobacterium vitis TaxID=373 RepID=UPI0008DC0FB6|nr:phage Gp37/Gp68 family protein [Agrobacterium vitis]MUO84844.1 DUF5131 family protein [Agrobacterium vitis]
MADNTKIEWTDATWNPITGCSIVSPGCTNCYAMKLAGTRLQHHPSRAGLTKDSKAGPVWNGQVRFNDGWLTQPLQWKKPRMIFVCAHGDLFAEGVPDEWIDKVFAVMALAPHHTFQVLTKRPERMREYLRDDMVCSRIGEQQRKIDDDMTAYTDIGVDAPFPLPNVWLGVSVEDQPRAEQRIPILLDTPAAIRWISAEPLLGGFDLRKLPSVIFAADINALTGTLRWDGGPTETGGQRLDWVVAGGESGRNARPMHPDWARSLRDQCAAAGVPFLFKQWGQWGPIEETVGSHEQFAIGHSGKLVKSADLAYPDGKARSSLPEEDRRGLHSMYSVGKKAAGRLLDGVEHNGFPEVQS